MASCFLRPQAQLVVLFLALSSFLPAAGLRLPRIFTDNMVLQQDLPIAVWGWATAGQEITVTFNGQSSKATADPTGKWNTRLSAMKADGKAYTLTVKDAGSQIELTNVALGEVWLCAGQSNMNRRQEIKEAHPGIRLFWIAGSTTPLPDDLGEEVAGWSESTPEGLAAAKPELVRDKRVPRKNFTEVGYVFGRRIHEDRKVPVGLIMSAFGGSQVRAWTPKAGLEKEYPFGQKVERSYVGHTEGLLYQSMIHGLVPMTIRGVVWYQGENDGRGNDYGKQMTAWIKSWRQLWGRDDLPFYYAQIAATTYASGMLNVWEGQTEVMKTVPHTGLAPSNDIYDGLNHGYSPAPDKVDAKDTGWPIAGGSNPHPPNKKLIANRLADIALAKTYGRPTDREVFGPIYDSYRIEGDKMLVDFLHTGKGLKSLDGKPLNWFEISDGTAENRNFNYVKATARIIGKDTVEVSAPGITRPRFVRFGWHSLARYNLVNSDNLPAVSFKTDPQTHHKR